MSPQKTYFAWALLLLIATCVLLLVGGYGERGRVIQVEERIHTAVAGDFFLSITILGPLFAFIVALGSLGSIQSIVPLPDSVKRVSAGLIAGGLVLRGLSPYLWMSSIADIESIHRNARWIAFAGLLCALIPLFAQLGACWWPARWSGRLARTGVKPMKAEKAYAVVGLVLLLWVVTRSYGLGWPWRELYVESMRNITAGLFTWPLGAALGAAALFLSSAQSKIRMNSALGVAGAILYFLGSIVFLMFLYLDLAWDRPWSGQMSVSTGVGLGIVLLVLLLNLVGLLRHDEEIAGRVPLN